MKKTSSAEKSQIAFVRVKNLKDHVEGILAQYQNQGMLKDDDSFKGKIWLKIGVRDYRVPDLH